MKAIFATNILFAVLISPGVCAKLLWRGRRRDFQLVICPWIREELKRVLGAKLLATPGEMRQALLLVDEAADIAVKLRGEVHGICRDSDGDHVLDCILASGAEYLLTGDADLLTFKEFHGSLILTPRKFELLFSD